MVIKGGGVFERLAPCTTLLFEKAGTLAAGRPKVGAGVAGSPPWAKAARRRVGLDGTLTVFVSIDGEPAGVVVLEDPIRTDAARTVRDVRQSGIERIVMVTGDRHGAGAGAPGEPDAGRGGRHGPGQEAVGERSDPRAWVGATAGRGAPCCAAVTVAATTPAPARSTAPITVPITAPIALPGARARAAPKVIPTPLPTATKTGPCRFQKVFTRRARQASWRAVQGQGSSELDHSRKWGSLAGALQDRRDHRSPTPPGAARGQGEAA